MTDSEKRLRIYMENRPVLVDYAALIVGSRASEEESYKLQTYPIICANPEKAKAGIEPAKIERFEPRLSKKILKRNRNEWRTCDSEQVMNSFFSSL